MNRTIATVLLVVACAAVLGFYFYSRSALHAPTSWPPGETTSLTDLVSASGGYAAFGSGKISFIDMAESNSDQDIPVGELTLLNTDFEDVRLADLQGDRNLLLVVIRGVPLCPFCTAQTSRLVSNYEEFQKRGTEVAVVFPGTAEDLKQLLKTAELDDQQLPFPILVDTTLTTIKRLNIEGNKAAPSTFIVDAKGRTRFAYVGANVRDRPSIAALLNALDRIKPGDAGSDRLNESTSTEASRYRIDSMSSGPDFV